MRALTNAVRLALLAASCMLVGCGGRAASVALTSWALDVPGRADEHEPLTLPAKVDDALEPSSTGDRPSHYVLRTRFEIPEAFRGEPLTFAVPCCLMSLASLRVDGEEAIALDASVLHRYRTGGSHSWRISAEQSAREALELELQVENTWGQSGWIHTVPRVSPTLSGDRAFLWVEAFNESTALAAFCTSLVVLLLYGVIYLSDRRRVAHGWYALGVIAAAIYPAFALNLLQGGLGAWETYVIAWSAGIAAALPVFFVRAYFGLSRPHWTWRYLPLGLLPFIAILGGAFEISTWLAPLMSVLFLLMSVHQVRVFLMLRKQPRPPPNHRVLTLVWPIAMLFGGADLVAWMGLGEVLGGLRPMSLSICLIALVQALAIGTEHTLSLKRADALNEERSQRIRELQERNREIVLLNEELRHQISARSRSLVDVLARVASEACPTALEIGAVVGERYRVLRAIGRGGMGEVYEVLRLADERRLALKILVGVVDPRLRARFAREANLIAQVDHPNVVTIVDVDISPQGVLYLVMEFVDGQSLAESKSRFGDVPWALEVLAGVARGLQGIHESGVVHRDLKPGNVLVGRAEDASALQVKITDFGISMSCDDKAEPRDREEATTAVEDVGALGLGFSAGADEDPTDPTNLEHGDASDDPSGMGMSILPSDAALTLTGVVLGTPAYMAPELAFGMTQASAASDIFSFGVLAVELLSGTRPQMRRLGQGIPRDDVVRLLHRVTEHDERLVRLVARCLATTPDERPEARDIVAALAELRAQPKAS